MEGDKKKTTSKDKQAKNVRKAYTRITTDVKRRAMNLIHIRLPEKVLEMQKIITGLPLVDSSSIKAIESEIDAIGVMPIDSKEFSKLDPCQRVGRSAKVSVGKKRKLDDGASSASDSSVDYREGEERPAFMDAHVSSNKKIAELTNTVKKEVIEMIETMGVIKLYIQLNIPQIEDGNNFGVEIQEEAVGEISKVEDMAFAMLDGINKYFILRGKLVSKVLRYPKIKDYKESIRELDGKRYVRLKMACVDIRNSYMTLHDIITKNEEKIRKPRGESEDAMTTMY
mmetsp:Transcript_7514/g.12274  ORF Transcript_7514/g.12274 Transcript_7514/m.12274 type:complete len:283 (-) Transcript_7514:201-1049(-)